LDCESGQRRGLHGQSDRRGPGAGGERGRTACADRLRAGVEGTGSGGQPKIAMLRQGRGLWGWTDGLAGKAILPLSAA